MLLEIMEIDIHTKIEHWKLKAHLFLDENIKCFIKTIDGAYHSAEIKSITDRAIEIYDFVKKELFRVYWIDIILFEEFKEDK